jgi:hypothetical protein
MKWIKQECLKPLDLCHIIYSVRCSEFIGDLDIAITILLSI